MVFEVETTVWGVTFVIVVVEVVKVVCNLVTTDYAEKIVHTNSL